MTVVRCTAGTRVFLCRSVAELLEFDLLLMLRTQHDVFGNRACFCSHIKKNGVTRAWFGRLESSDHVNRSNEMYISN